MHSVHRSALVPYSAEQMFRLVDDVEAYPRFLPWCHDARIEREYGDIIEASLELKKGALRKRFTTRNTRRAHEAIELELLGGPFRALDGGWRFLGLGDAGCKVSLDLEFAFESRALEVVLGSFFEQTCNSLVDAFTRRARTVYRD